MMHVTPYLALHISINGRTFFPFTFLNQCRCHGKGGVGEGTYFLLALLYDLAQEITSAPGHPLHNSLCWALMALEYCEQL